MEGTAVHGSGGPADHQTLLNSHPIPFSFFGFTDILPATASFFQVDAISHWIKLEASQ